MDFLQSVEIFVLPLIGAISVLGKKYISQLEEQNKRMTTEIRKLRKEISINTLTIVTLQKNMIVYNFTETQANMSDSEISDKILVRFNHYLEEIKELKESIEKTSD